MNKCDDTEVPKSPVKSVVSIFCCLISKMSFKIVASYIMLRSFASIVSRPICLLLWVISNIVYTCIMISMFTSTPEHDCCIILCNNIHSSGTPLINRGYAFRLYLYGGEYNLIYTI